MSSPLTYFSVGQRSAAIFVRELIRHAIRMFVSNRKSEILLQMTKIEWIGESTTGGSLWRKDLLWKDCLDSDGVDLRKRLDYLVDRSRSQNQYITFHASCSISSDLLSARDKICEEVIGISETLNQTVLQKHVRRDVRCLDLLMRPTVL